EYVWILHYVPDTSTLSLSCPVVCCIIFKVPAPTELYTLSLHDALPICRFEGGYGGSHWIYGAGSLGWGSERAGAWLRFVDDEIRSEEHTSELQSRENLVCRLLLEKKKKHVQQKPEAKTDMLENHSCTVK